MRVYAYGARAPIAGADIAREQLRLAHRYRNDLTAVELRRRAAVEAALDAAGPREPMAALRSAVRDTPEGTPERVQAEAALEAARAHRLSLAGPALAEANERAADERRAARAACGVYWGSYLLVEDADQTSRRSGREPRFRRWDGSGALAVQIQGGMTVADLLAGRDARARLVEDPTPHPADRPRREGDARPPPPRPTSPRSVGRRMVLHLRVGTVPGGRAPVWATFPTTYHRPLPEQAVVKWVKVVCRRVGVDFDWSVLVVLDGALGAARPAPVREAVGVDVGWRKMDDGSMRVASWVDTTGACGEMRVPARLLQRWQKVQDLRSIRDQHLDVARALLVEARREHGASWPEWLREATTHAHAWRASRRLAALVLRMREQGWDDPLHGALEAWRQKDKHLLTWESHQRENVLRSRRELYRVTAARLAEYRAVYVERLDLRRFAEVPTEANGRPPEAPAAKAARPRRFVAAVGEFLGAVGDAVQRAGGLIVEVPSAWTTQTCAECGAPTAFDAARNLDHTCLACGATWDQDANAARNLLASGLRGDGATSKRRSKPQSEGESEAQRRRREGAARKRLATVGEGR